MCGVGGGGVRDAMWCGRAWAYGSGGLGDEEI